ncbi:hypothetical protein R6Q59_035652 [Mikania micrantha]|nr:hypothetical protein E3N88_23571 [Mikania micrantha]
MCVSVVKKSSKKISYGLFSGRPPLFLLCSGELAAVPVVVHGDSGVTKLHASLKNTTTHVSGGGGRLLSDGDQAVLRTDRIGGTPATHAATGPLNSPSLSDGGDEFGVLKALETDVVVT